jgi:hypothetical protein
MGSCDEWKVIDNSVKPLKYIAESNKIFGMAIYYPEIWAVI